MKVAKLMEGTEIKAAKDAPPAANCRYCGGKVILRGRKVMGSNKKSYYWRHLDNQNRNCPGRARASR